MSTTTELLAALEAATDAVCEERNHPDYPCGRGDIDTNMARAAVLAFLKTMPAMTRHKLSTGDGGYAYSPDGWNLHALAAAIEETVAIRARGVG